MNMSKLCEYGDGAMTTSGNERILPSSGLFLCTVVRVIRA